MISASSRIENMTRELGNLYLMSEDSIKQVEGRLAYALRHLGPQSVRGKDLAVEVYAVNPAAIQ